MTGPLGWIKAKVGAWRDGSGADEAEQKLIIAVNDRLEEANDYRVRSGRANQGGMTLEREWELAGHRYLGNHWYDVRGSVGLVEGFRVFHTGMTSGDAKGIKRFTLNRTQNSIISNTASEMQQQLVVRFEPQESADPSEYMLSPDGGAIVANIVQATMPAMEQQAMMQADPEAMAAQPPLDPIALSFVEAQFTPEQLGDGSEIGPTAIITEAQAGIIKQAIEVGVLKDNDLVEINDKTRRDVAQAAFDALWNASNCDQHIYRNVLYRNIFGHQPLRFQFDHETPRFILDNTHILNVWIDPTHDTIDEADYLIFEHVLDADQAVAQWPDFEEAIAGAREKGQLDLKPTKTGSSYFRMGSPSQSTHFRRPMVRVRTAWLRHQQVAMTEREAVESGRVVQNPMEMMQEPPVEDMVDDSGDEVIEAEESGNEQAQEAPELNYLLVMDERGNPIEPEPTGPDAENWPKTVGVKEVVMLPQIARVVSDRRCAYSDIPFGWNVNIPRPYSPYGQGEPLRLEDLQTQINLVLTILANHIRYYQWPMRYWPKSLFEKLKSNGFSLHSRPGMEIPIDDKMWLMAARGGKMSMVEQVPPVPEYYVRLLELYLNEHDRLSGNVGVRQGDPPSTNMSGKALNSLIGESKGPLQFKANFTEWMMERIAKLALNAMVDFLSIEQWGEIVDMYALPALERIVEGIASSRWDITVEIATGRGVNQAQEDERAMALYDRKLLSKQTSMERVRVRNPQQEKERIMDEAREEAQASMPVQAAAVDGMTSQPAA